MPTLHCPLNGQALIKIGIDKGVPVFWCERTDTAYKVKPEDNPGVIIGINPKCLERRKNVWTQCTAPVSNTEDAAEVTSAELSNRCSPQFASELEPELLTKSGE